MANSLNSHPESSGSSDMGQASGRVVHVCALGFPMADMNLIASVVMLSRRRNPQLKLLTQEQASEADVFLIDSNNREALNWIEANSWVRSRCIIWVRSSAMAQPGEMVLHPPILWSQLSATITRALQDKDKTAQKQAGSDMQQASSAMVEAADTPESVGLPSLAPLERPKILVVDDSPTVRQYLSSLLAGYRLDVTEAADGGAALAAAVTTVFDCVLLDVLMPGMDGYETCRKLKARAKALGRSVPVVMLTSKGSPFDRIRGKMSGCDAYLTKPVGLSDLLKELSKYVQLNG